MESKFPPVTEFIQVPKLVLNPVLDLWDERRGWQRSGSWVLYVLHDEGCLCFILNAVVGLNAAKINVLSKCCTPGFKWEFSPRFGLWQEFQLQGMWALEDPAPPTTQFKYFIN